MPDDQRNEVPQAGKMTAIEKIGKVVRSRATAATMGVAIGLSAVSGEIPRTKSVSSEPSPRPSPALVKESPESEIVMNFTSFLNFTGDEMRAWADSNIGKKVSIYVDTDGLRLHSKLIDPDHVQFDLNLANYLQTPPKDGHPVKMRATTIQHEAFKRTFKLVPQDSKEAYSFPGDFVVTQGTSFRTKIDKLPRGTDSKEAYSEFVLLDFGSPSTEVVLEAVDIDFSEWWKLSSAERREKIKYLLARDLTFNIDTPNVRLHPIHFPGKENALIFDVSPASIISNIPTSLEERPVDVFISNEEYDELQRIWGTEVLVDPKGGPSVPALKVPQGTKLKFRGSINYPDFFLKFQGFTPPPSK